jgi:hypothetical protein
VRLGTSTGHETCPRQVGDQKVLVTSPCMNAETLEAKTLVAFVLALGTFVIATLLRSIRQSVYTLAGLRRFLADAGPAISLACMVRPACPPEG